MDALLILLPVAIVVGLGLYFGHTRCVSCGSRKTFNWRDETHDVSESHIKHQNHNQYCFQCQRITAYDFYGRIEGLRARIAERHAGKRIRQGGAH